MRQMEHPIKIPWKSFVFYKYCLPKEQVPVYEAIFAGLSAWEQLIPIPKGTSTETMVEIFYMVMRDHPMLFHVKPGFHYLVGESLTMVPRYMMTRQEYEANAEKVRRFLTYCEKQVAGRSDYDKIRILHDSMVKHVLYYGRELDKSHNVLGAIIERKGVCESIAKAFKLMCDVCMVPSIVVFGHGSSENEDRTQKENHAWNLVKLDGEWFHVDVTYDVGLSQYPQTGTIRYDYFCRSDQVFFQDHTIFTKYRPPSRRDLSIYRKNKLYVRTKEDLQAVVQAHAVKKIKEFVYEYDPTVKGLVEEMQNWLHPVLGKYYKPYRGYSIGINPQCRIVSISLLP